MSPSENPFVRDEWLDKPGIVGARWWNQSLREATKLQTRRTVLLVAGAATAMLACGVVASSIAASAVGSDDIETREEMRPALALQRDHGWNFGATNELLVYDGVTTTPFDRPSLARLVDELAPVRPDLQPYYVNTLFQSPEALPTKPLPVEEGQSAVKPIAEALRPIFTSQMGQLYKIGQSLATLLTTGSAAPVALVIDMDGPNAVAFAAGVAEAFDPVFLFDNWPHPRGVVPAHKTLAAAVYYQPRFASTKAARAPKWPAFVLDRQRLAPYVDDARQFDNRWFAKLPSASLIAVLNVAHVLYVVEQVAHLPELGDLNDVFVALDASKVDVRAVTTTAFVPRPPSEVKPGGREYFYGGDETSDAGFFGHYPWKAPPLPPGPLVTTADMHASAYHPAPRSNKFAAAGITGVDTLMGTPKIGLVPVVIAAGTGILLGAKLAGRNGTWGRSGGSSGWGS
ncbi:MAG TPA: hypothetical protein PK156_44585 [Polyangium sp.]|nr:hypothetical protein [Polyangium sp.]